MKLKKKTLCDLVTALAMVNAAFPAGEYHFNERQNLAMNALLETLFRIRQEDKRVDTVCKVEQEEYTRWILAQLALKGVITLDQLKEEVKFREKIERKTENGRTKKTQKEKHAR